MAEKNIRQIIKEVTRKSFVIYWVYFFVRYSFTILRARQVVIVATPGHVGSSSLWATLKASAWERGTLVVGIHSLNEKTTKVNLSARHVLQDVLRFFLTRKILNKKKIHIVTVVRDPIARALGAIFQSYSFLKQFENQLQDDVSLNLEVVKKFMLETGYMMNTVKYQVSYYQKEIPHYYQIRAELYDMNFGGNVFVKSESRSLSILTLENFNRDFPLFFEHHHQISPKLKIKNTNASRGGKYAELYTYCKNNLKFESEVVDSIYNNDFLIHLYGQKQLDAFKEKWRG
ncbi:MAG TPA: hypothetical protein VGK59_01760 [Ohtaekwangia sp.]